jgi:hypothetical protein
MNLEDEISRTQRILQPLIDRPQLKSKVRSKVDGSINAQPC